MHLCNYSHYKKSHNTDKSKYSGPQLSPTPFPRQVGVGWGAYHLAYVVQ